MAKKLDVDPTEHIYPLNINGLDGRMLRLAAPKNKKRQILLLYGSHASIERMMSIAQELNRYGEVTMPDWPGFGGMNSLYKINRRPDIDTMAEYLASFIKLRYKQGTVTIIAMSYAFAVVTRMLQKFPEMTGKVDFAVSIVGFVHKDDFHIPRRSFLAMKYLSWLAGKHPFLDIARLVVRGPVISRVYHLRANSHSKLRDAGPEEQAKRIAFEVVLWKINDLRTYFYTAYTMFILNLCDQQVDVPVYHVAVPGDYFFDNYLVEQHLRIIYGNVQILPVELKAHMPTIIASPKDVAPLLPPKLRQALAKAV